MLALTEAVANPNRHAWEGFPVLFHGPVLYIQLDTPRTDWADRVERFGAMGFDFTNVHFADIQTIPTFPFDILDLMKANLKWIQEAVAEFKPVLVIFDTLRDVHSGDENDATVMRNVLLQLIKATMPAICGLLSHRKKESAQMKMGGNDIMDDVRGSSAVVGKMDNVIQLTKTQLSWKGRADEDSVSIKQDRSTGLLHLDGAAAVEEATIKEVVQEERMVNPKATNAELAVLVCKRLKWDEKNAKGELKKLRTALRRVVTYTH